MKTGDITKLINYEIVEAKEFEVGEYEYIQLTLIKEKDNDVDEGNCNSVNTMSLEAKLTDNEL